MKEKERKKIVLASASPRRRELMKLLNMKFEVKTSDEEEVYQSTEPEEIVKELARQKAGKMCIRDSHYRIQRRRIRYKRSFH